MDFKQQNGSPGQTQRSNPRLWHQSSTTTGASTPVATIAPQKVTMRRRCRSESWSESLPMAPMMYHEAKSSKARLQHQGHGHHKTRGEVPTLLIESFSLQGNGRKQPELLPSITINNAKENVIQNGINAKDVYLNELDGYRKDRRNGYYIGGERQLESRFARNLESSFNPRMDRRKMRARSESEPHEIYTSATVFGSGRTYSGWSTRRDQARDVSLKRTRDTISPTLEADEALEAICSSINPKDSPPSKILNATDSASLDEAVNRAAASLQKRKVTKASQNAVNGARATKTVRTRTGSTVNIYKSSLKSAPTSVSAIVASGGAVTTNMGRKSVSPPLLLLKPGTTSPTPSGMSTGTSGGESVHTQDLDTETIGHSDLAEDDLDDDDDECDGEEDDLDDDDVLPEDDEVLNGSITDSEDNYQTHLAAYQARAKSNSTSPSPSPSIRGPVTSIGCVHGGCPPEGPLAPSLFAHVPPYITFSTHEEKGPPMPPAIHKVLKWKMTLITPIVVRKVLLNSGFRLLKKTNDWVGIWGKHMKSPCFKTLRPYQKFNHLPGSFQIGRKDRVWRNLQTQMNRHGKKEFGFMPRTYIIPQDLKLLRQMWPRYSQRGCKWIIKPPASARGTGIKVVNRWSQIPKRKPLIVQRYVERPLLINGSKFDLRLYVLVTSINPLRVFMHTDGLARFASVKYSEKSDTLSDRYMHLTNYSINKLSDKYSANEDADACQGHKWTIKSLWSYFTEKGVNTDRLWGALRNLVLRTVLAGEGPIHAMSKLNVGNRYNCYELFGIDVLLDSELVPWLLEVNISPSLHSASTLDAHVKGPLVKALLNTAMYQVPPRIPQAEQKEILANQGLAGPLCFDKRIYVTALSKVERVKHNQFIQKDVGREEYLSPILEELTPDDVRCLLLAEDELARSAPLERILPAPNSHRYIGFTEHPRYYNRLLDAWEHRYCHNRADGIALLQSLCAQRVHLQVPPSTLKKDSSSNRGAPVPPTLHPDSTTTSCENSGSQDSGIQSGSCSSAFHSQDSIDQIAEVNNGGDTVANAAEELMEVPPPPPVTNGVELDDEHIRLGDKIKLILDDALLLKQQQCGGDTENAIIVQQ
uniref:Putative tubulin-tyrosine ligase-related protein n=1 Tax=Culex tarsalis TaxID=7177 RepID=A0A1Q3F6B7_CULTA